MVIASVGLNTGSTAGIIGQTRAHGKGVEKTPFTHDPEHDHCHVTQHLRVLFHRGLAVNKNGISSPRMRT